MHFQGIKILNEPYLFSLKDAGSFLFPIKDS